MAEIYTMEKKTGVDAAVVEFKGGYPVALDGNGKEYVLRSKNNLKIGDRVRVRDTSWIKLRKLN